MKKIIPHLIAFVAIAIFSIIYFAPAVFDGKVLQQTDSLQGIAAGKEVMEYSKKENREILWSNSMFSGMPTYQGMTGNNYNYLGQIVKKVTTLFSPSDESGAYSTLGMLFMLSIGFYFLMVVLKVDYRIAIIAAIAFGISTNHILLIQAGHLFKVLALASIPPLLAGIILAFRGNYLWGAVVTAVFTALLIQSQHIQITFYFFLTMLIFVGIKAYESVKLNRMPKFVRGLGAIALGAILGLMTNITTLWTQQDYAAETIRGKSELVSKTGEVKNGLDKDYAFSWSFGKMETFSVLIPNFMGANSGEAFVSDPESASLAALRAMNSPKANELAQLTSMYWGDQPFTSGAPYFGAVIIFLYFLGIFLLKDRIKWWALGATLLLIVLGWGRNFELLNFFLFDHVPLFNKFRAVTMTYSLAHLMLVMLAFLALQRYLYGSITIPEMKKSLMKALYVTGGLCLFALLYSWVYELSGPNDAKLSEYPQLLTALKTDRAAALQADTFRSLLFILAAFGVLWASFKMKMSPVVAFSIVGLMAIIDIIGVDKRYLSNDDFIFPTALNKNIGARTVDNQINRDVTNYRVLDLARGGNPFANGFTSAFHKSIGGYSAAKLMIYQELIEKYLSGTDGQVLNAMATGNDTTLKDKGTLNALNMLNTKYVIYPTSSSKDESFIQNVLADGNVWFAKDIKVVANANEEIDAIATNNPKEVAIIQSKFANSINGFKPQYDSTNTIKLTNYVPDHITYESNSKTDQVAVFSEVYYPESKGMHIYIDGKLQPNALMKANYVLRATKVPAGNHKVEVIFEPNAYYTGVKIGKVGSLLTLLLLGFAIWTTYKKREYTEEEVEIIHSTEIPKDVFKSTPPAAKKKK